MTDYIVGKAQDHLQNIPLTVVSQGAEAIVFETSVHPYSKEPNLANLDTFIIKYRPPKPYRHPKIDAAITKNRTVGEAKFMNKLTKVGINAPNLVLIDVTNGIIWMEFIGQRLKNGQVSSLKNWFWILEQEAKVSNDSSPCINKEVKKICILVGSLIGKLHMNDMIHGDLTSSNIIINNYEPYLIDFGLSSYSGLPEDKAVDLYVFERAIISTHSLFADKYNEWVLEGYEAAHKLDEFKKVGGGKKLKDTLERLKDVRLRGRKRSMLG